VKTVSLSKTNNILSISATSGESLSDNFDAGLDSTVWMKTNGVTASDGVVRINQGHRLTSKQTFQRPLRVEFRARQAPNDGRYEELVN
jgi:hypothetical protein